MADFSKMQVLSDLFHGKNNAIFKGIEIFHRDKLLTEEVSKNKEFKDAIDSALPTFNYEEIVKVLINKYTELKLDEHS